LLTIPALMLDLTSMPRGVRDQISLLLLPVQLIVSSARFSPWEGTLTVDLKCAKCGENVYGDR
jgi:hypothetical protein